MRLISEFMLAGEEEIPAPGSGHPDHDSLPYFRCINLDLQAVINLYFLLRDEPYRDEFLDQFEVLHRGADDVLLRIPDSFVETLAATDPATLARVHSSWSEVCGITVTQWAPEYRRRVLESLVQFARRSVDSGKFLLLRAAVDGVTAETL